ncbi:hypothetical protein TNCV_968071 [Trichonephila clavipes]|nr:hypothetical protein TNCV_968071 [Trichonephila clavipes]
MYFCEVLQPEVVLFLQGIPGAIFLQANARPHVAKRLFETSRLFTDMWLIEHVWDLVDRRLARNSLPAASKDELFAAHTRHMEFSSTSRHSKCV